MTVAPGAANVVPGRVEFTLDVRAGEDAVRDATAADCLAALRAIADDRGVAVVIAESQALAASPCDPDLTDRMADAVAAVGQPVRRLVSGAGHDAMVMAALAPTTMLFIRCEGGISHNPDENVMAGDVELALRAMLAFIEGLAADWAGDEIVNSHG
jgi:allantoate deiminase